MTYATGSLTKNSCNTDLNIWDSFPPRKDSLAKLKRASVRNRSWFILLTMAQRKFIDAVIMTLDKIRSLIMLKALAPLIRKLLEARNANAGNRPLGLVREDTCRLIRSVADRIVQTAKEWGNESASSWIGQAFTRYLTVMHHPQNKNTPLITF